MTPTPPTIPEISDTQEAYLRMLLHAAEIAGRLESSGERAGRILERTELLLMDANPIPPPST